MASRKKKGPRRAAAELRPTTEAKPPAKPRLWIFTLAVAVVVIGLGIGAFFAVRLWNRATVQAVGDGSVAIIPAEDKIFPTYSGSKSCRECHALEFDRWIGSHHGLAERPLRDDLDKAAFDPRQTFHHGTQDTTVQLKDGGYQVVTKGLSGNAEPFKVDRVIGHDPLRQFLVDFGRGRLQTLSACYDPNHRLWYDEFANEDRQPGEWGHWTGRGMTWNNMCASCHNTRLRKNYEEATDTYRTSMAEMSVGCESCHGAMKDHVSWQHQYKGMGMKEPTSHVFTRDQNTETCATCHSRRGELTGDFWPGQRYDDHYALSIVDNTDLFYPDGQVRDEDYEYTAFLGSRMHAAGVRCMDCHDPHAAKPILEGNNLCMRCHGGGFPNAPILADPVAHTFHQPTSAGAQCINCHMPVTTYMQRHGRHDHGFTVPDPLLTKQLGIPNACNRCHTDHDADWTLAAVQKWYGPKMDRPSRPRATAIASARRGDGLARTGLLALLNNAKETFYWKAVAAGLLGQWGNEPVIATHLGEQLNNVNPIVRASAVHALGPHLDRSPQIAQAIRTMTNDGSRSVRIAAAAALGPTVDAGSLAQNEYLHCLTQQSDQATGQFQMATYEASRRNITVAIDHLNKALQWDSRSPSLRSEAAMLYESLSLPEQAVAQMEEACRLDPNNADFHYRLGLAYSEGGAIEKTVSALERTVQLDPRRARAWYNLGLARHRLGRDDPAIDAFTHAEAADPADPDIPFAAATLFRDMKRIPDARTALERALQIRPDYAPAIGLLRGLPQ